MDNNTEDFDDNKLIAEMRNTLVAQISHLQSDNIELSQDSSEYIAELSLLISSRHIFEDPKFENEKIEIQKLFERLSVILACHKDLLAQQIEKLSVGRMVVSAYKNGTQTKR